MSIHALSITNLTVSYNAAPALWNITATVPSGTLLGVVGPNGAGKTTLLKSIVQIIRPTAGSILLFNKPAQTNLHTVAYVPQRTSVDWNFPATVFDAVLMGRYAKLGWLCRPTQKDYAAVDTALEQVGLTNYRDTHIGTLSGGQQQRMFVARALVQDAQLYLLDEPFAGVDAVTEKTLIQIFKQLRSAGKTIIMVHHDLHTLPHYFDWALCLNIKQIACGPIGSTVTSDILTTTYQYTYPNKTRSPYAL